MTNKEAITYLEWLSNIDFRKKHPTYTMVTNPDQVEALKMAITALDQLDNNSTKPDNSTATQSNGIESKVKGLTACRVPEDDCISRTDAINTSLEFFVEFLGGALHENAQKELITRFQRLPSAQPEQCDFEKQLHDMFDHIWYCEINHPVFQDTVGDLMRAVIEAHYRTSQPEIIRCRDCKWSDISAMGHLAVCNHARGLINASPNSYCNFAERRTDEPDKQTD